LADAELTQGLYDDGERNLQQALAIIAPLVEKNPGNAPMRRTLARTYDTLAYASRTRSDLAGALVLHGKARPLYEQLLAEQPDNENYQQELAYNHKHTAAILAEQQQWTAALEHQKLARQIDEAAVARDPQNTDKLLGLTFGYSDTGYILFKQGEVDAALASHGKALAIREQLVAADPQNVRTRGSLSYTLNAIGDIHFSRGDFERAIKAHTQALAHREILMRTTPSRQTRFEVANSLMALGINYEKSAQQTKGQRTRTTLCERSLQSSRKAAAQFKQINSEGRPLASPEDISVLERSITTCERIVAG
jgi:tetratricopeptide (TPR) repeat protein